MTWSNITKNAYHIEKMQLVYLVTPLKLSFNVEQGATAE